MLFEDDTRIDLTICTLQTFHAKHSGEQYLKCLLDKDNVIPMLKNNQESRFRIKPIDEKQFYRVCSEFFWELQNVAKGLKRDELSYAMFIRDISMRDMLNIMLDAYIGMKNDYQVNTGTLGKYRKKHLSGLQYEKYRETYQANTNEDVWKSVFAMIDLFGEVGRSIAQKYNYRYPQNDERTIIEYLERVKVKE